MRNLHNIASLKSGTVHAAHDNAGRTVCRPNAVTEGEWVDDVTVNCGNCKRIIAEAERAAHIMATEEYSGVTDPKHEHLVDALRAATAGLRKLGRDFSNAEKWGTAMDLLHTQALAEAGQHETARRLEAVAKGRRQAVELGPDGLWSSLSHWSITDRLHDHHCTVVRLLAEPGQLDSMDLWSLGMAAFDAQRNLDIIHARVIGQCPGCFRDFGRWAHRVNCPMYFRSGDGFMPMTEAWSSEEIREFWTGGQHATAGR